MGDEGAKVEKKIGKQLIANESDGTIWRNPRNEQRTHPRRERDGKMGHSFCTRDYPIPRLTPLVQLTATTATTDVPSFMTTQAPSSNPPKRKVRSSGFGDRYAKRDIYEYKETRGQALQEFLRQDTPTPTNDGPLERKDSKRMRKTLLGGLFQRGRSAGVKAVAVGKEKSCGKRYSPIVVDEVEMERQRKERDQAGQEKRNGDSKSGLRKGEEERKAEVPPSKPSSEQVRKMNAFHTEITAEQRGVNDKIHPSTQDSEGKTGGKPKTKDKGQTKENVNPHGDSSLARPFRLLPKPDLGSTARDFASEGSSILARFGVAADMKDDDVARGLNIKYFTQDEAAGHQLPHGIWNHSDESSNQDRTRGNKISGFVPTVNNLWSIPSLSKTSERSASSPVPETWSKVVVPTAMQDPTREITPDPSTKPKVLQTPRCSQNGPVSPLPKNTIPITPRHSAQSSITQAWHTDAHLITPQHSAQNSIDIKKSPCSTLKHSRAASTFSAHGSIGDDGQSDVGSVEIMNAQSAEIVRAPGVAGFYARGTAKLPKPGPAPTRALPSLPEGHDGPVGMLGRVNGAIQSRIGTESALQRSPIKVPPSSPTGRYRYSPCKSPAPKLLVMPAEPNNNPENKKNRLNSSATLPGPISIIPPMRKCSLGGEMNAAILEQAQIQRVRSTNALKGRDLQRLYSDQANIEVDQPVLCRNEEASNKEVSMLSSARHSPGISIQPMTKEVVKSNLTETAPSSQVGPNENRTNYKISPIVLVTEQAPVTALACLGQTSNDLMNGPERFEEGGILHTEQDVSKKPVGASSGSENKEGSQKENPDTLLEVWPNPRVERRGSNDTTNHISISDQNSFTNTKDLESKLEARISTLERKNAILLRVVMAVLDESGNLSGPSGGDRSSGLSSTSSLYGSRESRLEAKFDAVLSLLQENKRLSTEQ